MVWASNERTRNMCGNVMKVEGEGREGNRGGSECIVQRKT